MPYSLLQRALENLPTKKRSLAEKPVGRPERPIAVYRGPIPGGIAEALGEAVGAMRGYVPAEHKYDKVDISTDPDIYTEIQRIKRKGADEWPEKGTATALGPPAALEWVVPSAPKSLLDRGETRSPQHVEAITGQKSGPTFLDELTEGYAGSNLGEILKQIAKEIEPYQKERGPDKPIRVEQGNETDFFDPTAPPTNEEMKNYLLNMYGTKLI